MHEYALAEAVVDAALQAAERDGVSEITRMVVRLGELQNVEKEIFEFALKEVLPASEPRLARAEITIEAEPARFRCRPCGRAFGLDEAGEAGSEQAAEAIHLVPELAHAFLRCPACHSPDFEVTEGRGLGISVLEGN